MPKPVEATPERPALRKLNSAKQTHPPERHRTVARKRDGDLDPFLTKVNLRPNFKPVLDTGIKD